MIGISEGLISVPLVNIRYENLSRLMIQADINISSGNNGGAVAAVASYKITSAIKQLFPKLKDLT